MGVRLMKLHDIRKSGIYERIITAVNIAIGDDGFRDKEILNNFIILCKLTEEEYEKERNKYG